MNLGTARIAIVLALVVAGIVVLANGFGPGTAAITPVDHGGTPTSSASVGPSTHPSHTPKPLPSPDTTGVRVSVFNGITAAGCAQKVYTKLVGDGYVGADPPSDATRKPTAKTIVYFRPDPKRQAQSDAAYIAKTYFNNAPVRKLSSTFPGVVSSQAQAVVLIGNDYAANC